MKLKNIVLAEINLLKLHIAHQQRQEGLLKKLLDIKLWNEVPPKIDFIGVPSAGPASQVQELKTWREHYKVPSTSKIHEPQMKLQNGFHKKVIIHKLHGCCKWAFQQIQSYNMPDTHPQGLALAAKSAGNKEEALNNMKFIKVIPSKQPKQKTKQFQATNLSAGL